VVGGLAGCTLSRDEKRVITATPLDTAVPLMADVSPASPETPDLQHTTEAMVAIAMTDTATAWTITPAPTNALPVSSTPTITVPASLTPVLAITAVSPTASPVAAAIAAAPPTLAPLDDGSGGFVPGTGNRPQAGVESLPETLYYLSNQDGIAQVWRLRYGVSAPDRLTSDPDGVRLFDVAADGTLAYVTSTGQMVVGDVPFEPPQPAQITSVAWSPAGDWLAYTLMTPGADQANGGLHAIDGLWIQNRDGLTVLLEANTYAADESRRVYTGPLDWRPDGSEVLIAHERGTGHAYSRVDIVTGAVTPVWNDSTLLPDSITFAQWSINGNAIITSGAGQVLRVEPDTLGTTILLGAEAGFQPENAQQFGNGAVTFLDSATRRLYLIPPDLSAATPVTDSLTSQGRVDFLWDNFGEQTLIVVYDPADSVFGSAVLRDKEGALHSISLLPHPVGLPRWGAMFRIGDTARVQTSSGDTLNIRETPDLSSRVLIQLSNAAQVKILGGPRWAEDYRWWRVQTTDGIAGWAVESVTDERGLRLRTLLPVN